MTSRPVTTQKGAAPRLSEDERWTERLDEADFEDDDCSWCGGEGTQECLDPIQCTRRHYGNRWTGFEDCHACGGSGMAKDQTLW